MDVRAQAALTALYAAKGLPPLKGSDGSPGFIRVDEAINNLELLQDGDITVKDGKD
jgi:hypothetical protein